MHPHSPAATGLTRRGVLVGTAAFAGAAATATAPAAEAAPGRPARATVFRNVRPYGAKRPTDLVAVDGLLTSGPAPHGAEVVDGGGRIALPTLVDAHIHPDKTAWGEPWVSRNPAGSIAEYAEEDVKLYHALRTPLKERAERLMGHAVTRGTRAMRAHADVAPAFDLAGVEGVGSARRNLRHALDVVFGIADRHGVGVDIHLHERAATGLESLRAIIARTRALSLQGKVTVSHVFCVPGLPGRELDQLAAELADAGISLTTVAPSSDLVLPIGRLRAHGVEVGLGSDGVRDSWSPFGNADMLHRAHLLAWVGDARLDEELEAAFRAGADGGARLLGLPETDLKPGSPADFLLVRGECLPQILVDLPQRDLVIRAGRVMARDGELTGR
ncbi:amidohydrolase family protein [Streptomyces albidoflavus]|uniref:amidohydrolase family protein n=1 Tax=Streptomyces TaxID=1883 RepID=UPI00224EAAE6|nr:amidohydrolase family protein [Streptomyces sp. FT1]MCX5457392.1 amidohydrolase family protein [Streptomyces sp. FT1]